MAKPSSHNTDPAAATQSVPNPFQQAVEQRVRILRFIRFAFFACIATVAVLLIVQGQSAVGGSPDSGFATEWYVPVALAIFLFCVALLVDFYTPNKKLSTISAIFFGLLAGMLATAAASAVTDLLIAAWVPKPETIASAVNMVKVMLGMALCYLGVSSVIQTQDDFRLVIPYVEFARQTRGIKPNVLDTSALIDARIADICATGLLQSPVIIPRFVIAELQLLADSADKLKRARGRRGLDIVTRLQRLGTLDVSIDDSRVSALSVDQMLVELAMQLSGRVVTTDLALTRIAQIHGVSVLNLHELANAFKPAMISGESLNLRLVKHGEQAGQGVGYLEDGTMVVVENGAAHIGSQVELLVTGSMQTSAGRLVFARIPETSANEGDAVVTPAPDALAHPASLARSPDAEPLDTQSSTAPAASPTGDLTPMIDDLPESSGSAPGAPPRRGPAPPQRPPQRRDGSPSPRNPRR